MTLPREKKFKKLKKKKKKKKTFPGDHGSNLSGPVQYCKWVGSTTWNIIALMNFTRVQLFPVIILAILPVRHIFFPYAK